MESTSAMRRIATFSHRRNTALTRSRECGHAASLNGRVSHFTATGGAAADLAATERQFSEHNFAYLELRAARAYLERRIAIAKVKQEHGLLTEEEQDALMLEAAELKADIELWRKYR